MVVAVVAEADAGAYGSLASVSRSLENSREPRLRYGSGILAQTNMVALGEATGQPSLLSPSTSTLRRKR